MMRVLYPWRKWSFYVFSLMMLSAPLFANDAEDTLLMEDVMVQEKDTSQAKKTPPPSDDVKEPGHPKNFKWQEIEPSTAESGDEKLKVKQTPVATPSETAESLTDDSPLKKLWVNLDDFKNFRQMIDPKMTEKGFRLLANFSKTHQPRGEFVIFDRNGKIRYLGSLRDNGRLQGLLLKIPEKRSGALDVSLFHDGLFVAHTQFDLFEYEDEEQVLYKTFRPIQLKRYSAQKQKLEVYQRVEKPNQPKKFAIEALPPGRMQLAFNSKELEKIKSTPDLTRKLEEGELNEYLIEFRSVQKYASKILSAPFSFGEKGPLKDLSGNLLQSPFIQAQSLWKKANQNYLPLKVKTASTNPEKSFDQAPREARAIDTYLTEEGRYLFDN